MSWLLVMSANVYIGNRREADTKAKLLHTNPDLVGIQEGSIFGPVPGFTSHGPTTGSRGKREVPVLVRRDPHVTFVSRQTHLSAPDLGNGYLHDRWTNVVRARVRGAQVSLLNTHAHPFLQTADGTMHKDARHLGDVRRHLRQLVRLAEAEREAGWAPIITLDANLRRPVDGSRPWWWAPHQLFPRHGIAYAAQGVDGIGYDETAFTLMRRTRVSMPGSNHSALLALLGVRS